MIDVLIQSSKRVLVYCIFSYLLTIFSVALVSTFFGNVFGKDVLGVWLGWMFVCILCDVFKWAGLANPD